jgi:hypothetical protein
MTRVQFSLTGLLIAVFVFALACAAIASKLAIVASAVFTLQYALLAFGIVGIVARNGAQRLFWVGFVVFGGVYSFATQSAGDERFYWIRAPYWSTDETLITDRLLQLAFSHRRFAPEVGSIVEGEWMPGSFYPAKVTQVGPDGSVFLTWLDGSAPKWVTPTGVRENWITFRATGHAVFAILASLIGGYVSMLVFGSPSKVDQQAAKSPIESPGDSERTS